MWKFAKVSRGTIRLEVSDSGGTCGALIFRDNMRVAMYIDAEQPYLRLGGMSKGA